MSPSSSHAAQRATSIEQLLQGSERLLFASSDLDETRLRVGGVMQSHRLGLGRDVETLDARMYHVGFGEVTLSRLRYGATVTIDPDPLENFYLVQMPVAGGACIQSNGLGIDSDTRLASVLNPDDEVRMRWLAGNDQLMLRLSRSLVERTLVGLLGHPLDEPLRFDLGFRWREQAAWRCLLDYLADCAVQCPDLVQNKLVLSSLEQLAASVMLSSHRHNYSRASPARCGAVLPRHVRRVQDYLQAHVHEPITIDQLALVAGSSVRSLYAGFRDFLGVSPMSYLHALRLERVRAELVGGDARNVTGVALRWGFSHMGRFSSDYKRRYGETPSQTLRRNG
ncbi:MAG: AraC family transcriptional regulator [Castellaniella sp.]|uniref:AraC family transcriptional regulator n=1 Tax=Castellaniella sp. TaxID=1955812 RepID=UPI003A83D043